MRFYIAAPFFNERQIEIVEEVKEILDYHGATYFSPKDDCLFENGKGMDSSDVFKTNCAEIEDCDAMIVITDDGDMGTIWEAGYAFGIQKENVIYAWIDFVEGAKFNLMLAHGATITVKGIKELSDEIFLAVRSGSVAKEDYSGELE